MCSAAHAWVGLGRIVYAASGEQLLRWLVEWGVSKGPVRALAINQIAPDLLVDGPADELTDQVRSLHARHHRVTGAR